MQKCFIIEIHFHRNSKSITNITMRGCPYNIILLKLPTSTYHENLHNRIFMNTELQVKPYHTYLITLAAHPRSWLYGRLMSRSRVRFSAVIFRKINLGNEQILKNLYNLYIFQYFFTQFSYCPCVLVTNIHTYL